MSEDTPPPSVAERAVRRYEAAREGMQINLATLANRALHSLHGREQSHSDVVLGSVIIGESGDVEILPARISTWLIPHAQYYLPDWQRGDSDRDFFDLSLEHALVKMTAHGAKAIFFDGFVQRCNLSEYVDVCRGLEELDSPILAPPVKGSDGMDND